MVELGAGDGVGGMEGVHEEVVGWGGVVGWSGVAVEVDSGGGLDEGVDMQGVADGGGVEVEFAEHVAVD